MELKYRTSSTGVVSAVAANRRLEPADIVHVVRWCTEHFGRARENGWGSRVQERTELMVRGDELQKLSEHLFFYFELLFCTTNSAAMRIIDQLARPLNAAEQAESCLKGYRIALSSNAYARLLG